MLKLDIDVCEFSVIEHMVCHLTVPDKSKQAAIYLRWLEVVLDRIWALADMTLQTLSDTNNCQPMT